MWIDFSCYGPAEAIDSPPALGKGADQMAILRHLSGEVDYPSLATGSFRCVELIEIMVEAEASQFLIMIDLSDREKLDGLKFFSPDPEVSGSDRFDVLCHVRDPGRENPVDFLPYLPVTGTLDDILAKRIA